MSTGSAMEAFLDEGIRRYADAADAVDEFERQMMEVLYSTLEQKSDWKHFQPRRGERGRGKAVSAGSWSGASGRTIWSNQLAQNDHDGWVDLGFWWRSVRARDGVIMYCSRWDPGYKARAITLENPSAPIVCGVVDASKPRLYAPLSSAAEAATLGRLLLDEMDRALGNATR